MEEQARLITGQNTPEAREIGARQLLQNGSVAAAARLAAILRDSKNPAAQQAICRAIARHPGKSPAILIEPLLALLGRHPDTLDDLLVLALRRFDSGAYIPRLRSVAGDSSVDLAGREAAVRALGEVGDDLRAVAALMELIPTDGDGLRSIVLDALAVATGLRHPDRVSALAWWEPRRKMTRLEWLSEVNARRSDVIQRLRAENDDLIRRLVMVYREAYLQTPEGDRVRRLLDYLGDESAAIRGLGLDLINTMITDRREVGDATKARLVEMLADPDPGVRRSCALIVGDLRPTGAFERLRDSLKAELDYRIRVAQVVALGGLDDPRSIPVLSERLEDDSSEVIAASVTALGMLARRGQAEDAIRESVSRSLLDHFQRVPETDDLLRQPFLEALARIGSESARAVFVREMDPRRSVRIRRAAIAGLALYGDARAAERIRPSLHSAGAEIRLSAVQALARCGQGGADLEALLIRIDASQESNPVVREQAWESYLSIVRRMPPKAQLEMAGTFAQSGEPAAQRRRLDLLKSLKSQPNPHKRLSWEQRLALSEGLAEALFELGEYEAAAAGFKDVMALHQDVRHPGYGSAGGRRITALLRANRDEEALSCLGDAAAAVSAVENDWDPSGLIEAVLEEARRRLETAEDPDQFSGLYKLYLACQTLRAGRSLDVSESLASLEGQITNRRDGRIGELIDRLGNDAAAEGKLIAFGPASVLPHVHARLVGFVTTSGPAGDREGPLIALARRLSPGWAGYAVGCPSEERAAALETLQTLIGASSEADTTSGPTSPGA